MKNKWGLLEMHLHIFAYSIVLNCRGGGGGGGVTLQISTPISFYYEPPILRIFQKIVPPPILFPPPHYMQNEYHFCQNTTPLILYWPPILSKFEISATPTPYN